MSSSGNMTGRTLRQDATGSVRSGRDSTNSKGASGIFALPPESPFHRELKNASADAKKPKKDNTVSLRHRDRRQTVADNEALWSRTSVDFAEIEETKKSVKERVGEVILSQDFDKFVGMIVIGNFICIACEVDASAKQLHAPEGSSAFQDAESALDVIEVLNLLFLAFYIVELGLRFYVEGKFFFMSRWNNFDLATTISGALDAIVTLAMGDSDQFTNLQVLRIMRMVRLLRVTRVLVCFKELYSLVSGLASCMKTLMWSAGLILIILTFWSIVAVEYLNPLVKDLADKGNYDGCGWCEDAYDSIMLANLTFFQVISGDGWSRLARPLIETHPWTAFVFISVIFMVVFGMLNLVTAVLVDTAATARERDVETAAREKARDKLEAWNNFAQICHQVDKDESGDISMKELLEAFDENSELGAHLSVMGVEKEDLEVVFDIMDVNRDGSLTYEEFGFQLYKLKTSPTQTAICVIKHHVAEMRKKFDLMLKSKADEIERQKMHREGQSRSTFHTPSMELEFARYDSGVRFDRASSDPIQPQTGSGDQPKSTFHTPSMERASAKIRESSVRFDPALSQPIQPQTGSGEQLRRLSAVDLPAAESRIFALEDNGEDNGQAAKSQMAARPAALDKDWSREVENAHEDPFASTREEGFVKVPATIAKQSIALQVLGNSLPFHDPGVRKTNPTGAFTWQDSWPNDSENDDSNGDIQYTHENSFPGERGHFVLEPVEERHRARCDTDVVDHIAFTPGPSGCNVLPQCGKKEEEVVTMEIEQW